MSGDNDVVNDVALIKLLYRVIFYKVSKMLLLLLFILMLHRHNGAHGICDVLTAAMRHYPCMHVIGYDVPPRLAFH